MSIPAGPVLRDRGVSGRFFGRSYARRVRLRAVVQLAELRVALPGRSAQGVGHLVELAPPGK